MREPSIRTGGPAFPDLGTREAPQQAIDLMGAAGGIIWAVGAGAAIDRTY